jgi:poly [ADP-ribose] polymerase
MFGKGVYFADMVTKSGNYCFTSRENNTGLMLLCEVALGDCNEKYYADYYANLLPPGKMSTKGCGKTAPGGGKHLEDIFVPCGKGVNTGIPHVNHYLFRVPCFTTSTSCTTWARFAAASSSG